MCPRYFLSDNGMEFKNNLTDQVLQQLGIDRIFSAPYHPQSNGKLEVFHKYLKPTLKKLCEKDPANWDKYINQVLASYRITPNLATAESPFFWSMAGTPMLCNPKYICKNNRHFSLSSTYILYPLASLPKMVRLEMPASVEQS